ncbi:MAG: peptidoglycan-binding protein, partial [Pseudomonadota bacterium]
AFPASELGKPGAVLMPAGRSGPAFIATPNFYVIKKYNNSDLYALFVGNVADRIEYSNKPFAAGWQKVSGLKRGNVMTIQNGLIALGYDVGGADGLAGFKTRRSIGDWQQKNGFAPTCFPDKNLAGRF